MPNKSWTIPKVPELIMMIGLPSCGKSTWIEQHMRKNPGKNFVIISSDAELEKIAERERISYEDAFIKHLGEATRRMWDKAKRFSSERNVIWDQTNLTQKSRKKKLEMFDSFTPRTAVVFSLTNPELARRTKKRLDEGGKTVPPKTVLNMARSFQTPTKDEGFDKILRMT